MKQTINETYQELKARQAKELNEFEGVFWAFSNDQFEQGMKKIGYENSENLKEKIFSLGAGGYIRKDKSKAFHEMFKRHAEEKKQRRQEEKFLLDSLVYELCNHEFCITYDPTDDLDALGYDRESIDPKILHKACQMAL